MNESNKLFNKDAISILNLMARNYAQEFSKELIVIEDKICEFETFIKNTIDVDELTKNKNYLEEYEKKVNNFVKYFANERTIYKGAWVYFDPSFSENPHDVYYVDDNGDGNATRQEYMPFSYYDNTPTENDDKQWWYGPKETKKGFWTNPYEWKLSNGEILEVTSYAKPIYIDGKFICVIGTYYNFDNIISTIKEIKPYNSGYAVLFNEKLDVITHPEFKSGTRLNADNLLTVHNGNYSNVAKQIAGSKDGVIQYSDGGVNKILAYSRLSNDWVMGIIPKTDDVFSELSELLKKLIYSMAACIVIAVICAIITGKTITKPLLEVVNTVKIIAKGNLLAKINVKTKDEIKYIGDSINIMTENTLKLQNKLYGIAYVDELTNEMNYNKFKEQAQVILENDKDTSYVLVKFDINNFKLINRLYGFSMGDDVIIGVSNAIKSILFHEEIFARVNGDEFVALHKYINLDEISQRKTKFESEFYKIMGENFKYRINFPLGCYNTKDKDKTNPNIEEMYEKVNFAHKIAKQSGMFNCIVNYDEYMTTEILHQKEVENNMEYALLNDEFKVYLQPKYKLDNLTINGAEALVRWQDNDKNIYSPNSFISIFEKNGFITKLDMYMLKKVCAIINNWIDEGIEPVTVSVNFSRLHLKTNTFLNDLCSIVDSYGIPRELIEIELTETAIFDNMDILQNVLLDLHRAGFTLSMDDFGSGYSSLGLLKDLPVDVIKIDRSFFINQIDEGRTRVVLENVMKMARDLNIKTVAEGVEEKKHINFLSSLHCDMVQGYYFAKPMTQDEFTYKLKYKRTF